MWTVSPRGVTPTPPFWGSLNAAEKLVGSPTGDAGGTPKAPPGTAEQAAGTAAGKGPARGDASGGHGPRALLPATGLQL